MMRMAMFDGIKAEDRIYSYIHDEFGAVRKTDYTQKDLKPIIADLDSGKVIYFDYNGKENKSWQPTVFWDKIQFEIPQKPFDLKTEYKKLKRTKNKTGIQYEQITYTDGFDNDKWGHVMNGRRGVFGAPQFCETDDFYNFIELLNKYEIKPQQLEQVIKEVENED